MSDYGAWNASAAGKTFHYETLDIMRGSKNLIALGCLAGSVSAIPPDGIPRELARERAEHISGVRYQLSFSLLPNPAKIEGHEELRFSLDAARTVLLDFRDGVITRMLVNGTAVSTSIENGHVSLPGRSSEREKIKSRSTSARRLRPRGAPSHSIETPKMVRSTFTPYSFPWTPAWRFPVSISPT